MTAKENKTEAQEIVDLLKHWLKYWYIFIISGAICGAIGLLYYKLKTPVMQVKSSVSIRHDDAIAGTAGMSQASSLMSSFGLGSGGAINVEDETLKVQSQSHVKAMVKNLGLNIVYENPKFMGLIKEPLYDASPVVLKVDPNLPDTLTAGIKFNIELKTDGKADITLIARKKEIGKYKSQTLPVTYNTVWGDLTFDKSDHYDQYEKPMKIKGSLSSYDYMAQLYREGMEIDYEKKTSDIIHLGIQGENVALNKRILSELINVYNDIYDKDKNLVNEKTAEFIDERLAETQQALDLADLKIKQFKDKNKITEIEADVTYYFTMSGEIQKLILEAETQLSVANLMTDFVKDERNQYALIPYSLTISETGIAEVITTYNELLSKRNDMNKGGVTTFGKSVDDQIELQRKNLVKSLDNVIDGLKASIKTLRKRETEFNAKLGGLPTVEKDYIGLRREQEIQQTMYIFLLQMKEENGVKGVRILPKLQIVDSPYMVNEKVAPKLMKIGIVVIFLGGILIPLSIIYLVPFFKSLFRKKKDE
jgi:hypothetical protein